MGRGNQYIQLVKVLYRKLPTNSKKLPAATVAPLFGFNVISTHCAGYIMAVSFKGRRKQLLLVDQDFSLEKAVNTR